MTEATNTLEDKTDTSVTRERSTISKGEQLNHVLTVEDAKID